MSVIFEHHVEQQGWNEETQIQILLEYIENQQSNDAFESFLSEKSTFKNMICANNGSNSEAPLGLRDALSEQEEDNELILFECEIGLFDIVNDPNTPIKTHTVVVAACSILRANEKAQMLCEENIPAVSNIAFAPTCMATEVDVCDYA